MLFLYVMNILYTFSHDCMKEIINEDSHKRPSRWRTKSMFEMLGFPTPAIKWKTPLTSEDYTYSSIEYDRRPMVYPSKRHDIIARCVKSFYYELNIAMNLLQECQEDNYIDFDSNVSKIRYITRIAKKRYIHDIIWQSFHLRMKKTQ